MKCLTCGTEFNRKFCPMCGTPAPQTPPEQPVFCPVCGTELFPDDQFCPHCGRVVDGHSPDDLETTKDVYGTPSGGIHEPSPEKNEKNTTMLIVIIVSIAVVIIAGLTVLLILNPFGKGDNNNGSSNARPTETVTVKPTEQPTERPTERPTQRPTERPTPRPTERPTPAPTQDPVTATAGTYKLKSVTSDGMTMSAETISEYSETNASEMSIKLLSDSTFILTLSSDGSNTGYWTRDGSKLTLIAGDETIEGIIINRTITITAEGVTLEFEK